MELIQCSDTLTVDEALDLMVKHSQDNPTHGYNCACKDPVLRAVRKGIVQKYDSGSEVTLARSNLRYLLDTLTY